MLERVLLDANTLLNATFIPQSWSRLVISKLVQQRKSLFVGSRTFLEAREVARKIAAELRKSKFDDLLYYRIDDRLDSW